MASTNRAMGIGVIGGNDVTFKRKFRFTFQIVGFCNNVKNIVPEYFVKVASRPNLDIEETEINFLNAKTWIPGKASWQTMTVTYIDAADVNMQSLWNWLATVYNFTDPIGLSQGNKIDWNATGILSMYDGCGTLLEQWQLQHMWPQAIDFGDLAYAESDMAEIELTLRFSDVIYKSFCPAFTPAACCTGCDGGIAVADTSALVTGSN
jgi:T4-like virus tail tube protein gp19